MIKTKNNNMITDKKKVFLTGPLGSGKTEIAINLALYLNSEDPGKITLIDLDMVKPYFRLRSVKEPIKKSGIEVLTPEGPYQYTDFPIITARMESYIISPEKRVIIDVGGETVGARIVGRYRGNIDPGEVEVFYVFNGRRSVDNNLSEMCEDLEQIRRVLPFPLTGIIHNSHLMNESTVDILESHIDQAKEISNYSGIPLRFHCIREDLYKEASKTIEGHLLPLKLLLIPEWL
ncbi:MAG: hypothetical protein K8T10_17180 [Candidatus Eremiobacteraeota bacterium]|nr:hypothetical protein [Candidatus Eremiobacteraeota bacterium]